MLSSSCPVSVKHWSVSSNSISRVSFVRKRVRMEERGIHVNPARECQREEEQGADKVPGFQA